ncbi:SLAM family member 5-like [Mobula hypostoma]|uniref:SLAM family member 5-like n=1 Tax=Mobula hypostoma TaxID=723540 RepID=UPI002FC3DA10
MTIFFFTEQMAKIGSGIVSGLTIIYLLLSDSGVLAETDGSLATYRVVNGALGQSVVLPGNVSGESISVVTWDYANSSHQKMVQLCVKYKNSPTTCNRERMTLKLKDCSLEIQNLTDSDEGFYEINARTDTDRHQEVMELRIYVLAGTNGNPATRCVVNGTLGQSVTLPGNVSGENISFIAWDYTNSSHQKKIQLCVKYTNNPTNCKRERVTLNLKDYSLEIQNLTYSDEGLYEINARTDADVHHEVMELRIYERVSTPVITSSQFVSNELCNISLDCLLERGTKPVYSWWTGDDKVTTDESHVLTDEGRSLELSLRPSDNRVYNCTVRNPVSEATMSVDLRNLCPDTEGEKLLGPFHICLITTITLIAFITAIVFTLYWKRELKINKGKYSRRHLHQLDANKGRQNPRAELTTIYDDTILM